MRGVFLAEGRLHKVGMRSEGEEYHQPFKILSESLWVFPFLMLDSGRAGLEGFFPIAKRLEVFFIHGEFRHKKGWFSRRFAASSCFECCLFKGFGYSPL